MTAQVIQRGKLVELSKIGQGGQGVVYAAPNVKTKFAVSMVYKEYRAPARAAIDFTALAAMPALVEDSLSYAQAERLVSIAAWPCALVDDAGGPTGFVMPAIPEQFFVPLKTVKGVSSTTAEFQHLLNHASVLEARGITIVDAQRYSLLREVASALAFLHKHGVCVGDISPKNLLFSLAAHEAVYFIDCDSMRINGISALHQVETPGWEVPSGEELATIYSDAYKLGLLALRLLAGDHHTKNLGQLPATTPDLLRQIVTDTLNNPPEQRPLPEAWAYVLGHAIEQAQHRQKTAAAATGGTAPEAPPIPVVHARPQTRTPRSGRPTVQSTPAAGPSTLPQTGETPPPLRHRPRRALMWLLAVPIVAVLAAGGVIGYHYIDARLHPWLPFSDLSRPRGVALDTAGNVYVTDSGNLRVLKLAVGSSTQTVLPFTGLNVVSSDESLHGEENLHGVAVDTAGNVYVADNGNNRVLKLSAGTNIQTVLPFTGLQGVWGVAVDSAANLYVADVNNNRVLELAAGSANPTVLPFADLSSPAGVAVDTNGDVYVVDVNNKRVLELAAGSTNPTVLPLTNLTSPLGVAVDGAGDVYVTDSNHFADFRVVKWAPRTGQSVLPYHGSMPSGVAVDGSGSVYVADAGNGRVVKLPAG